MGKPPQRKVGQGRGHRPINGLLLGVREAAKFLGYTEKSLRTRIARGRIPYRREGGRIVFVRAELDRWVDSLPGVRLDLLRCEDGR